MKKNCIFLWLLVAVLLMAPLTSAHAYSITAFGYNAYNSDTATMDAAFGIAGLVIEDFEDNVFIPGLSISTGYLSTDGNANWDGSGIWRNSVPVDGGRDIDFAVSSGASKFGVGLGQFEYFIYGTEVDVYVNNTLLTSNIYYQNGYSGWYGESYRNMYIVVEAEAGEVINNVTLGMTSTYGNYDGVTFDHVAIDPVPEPTTMLLLGTGLIGLAGFRRKSKKG